ncbi:MAG TPA: ABC transporter ATP-binding protein [Clostridiaceae bacterium]|nr:ABC transporter ATP-binding protein [Clostridiaceae bacterium]
MKDNLDNILEIKNVYAGYATSLRKAEYVLAGLSMIMKSGEFLGIVGESGSGKTTLANLITGFVRPISGEIYFQGQEVQNFSLRQRIKQFNCGIQMVFQDPYSSFNPKITIGKQLMEPLEIQKSLNDSEIEEKARQVLEQVGLSADYFSRYPHQLSGGQLQRVALGCALIVEPRLLIADEPVSSLDVSVQAQVLDLIMDLRKEYDFSCLFISHDLAVIYHLCDTVAVLDRGIIVEQGNVEDVFQNPQNVYTKQLISDAGYSF